METRQFVYGGDIFEITRAEDGSVGTPWSGQAALSAAVHVLWAVAEERDAYRFDARRLIEACASEGAKVSRLAKERDGMAEERDKLREVLAKAVADKERAIAVCDRLRAGKAAAEDALKDSGRVINEVRLQLDSAAAKSRRRKAKIRRLKAERDELHRLWVRSNPLPGGAAC